MRSKCKGSVQLFIKNSS